MHQQADRVTQDSFKTAWAFIEEQVNQQGKVSERAVCDRITDYFESQNMMTYSPPIVARAPNNRLPHYETGTGDDISIRAGDLVMIDQWCKLKTPGAIYSDVTRMAFVGDEIPTEYAKVFAVVTQARDAGIDLVKQRFSKSVPLYGWEIDRVVRDLIEAAGYGDAFLHRTGHSLGEEVHGNGAHLDDLEMHEDRLILPETLFTIEPGIYLEHFGVRSEVDLFIDSNNEVHVTGGIPQQEILKLSVS
jgi:Xaa-Pro aminopeptidase